MFHFQIIVNESPIQLGAPLPDTIHYLAIYVPPVPIQFPSEQVPLLKSWLNDLADRLTCEYFSYNGILIPVSEITKF